MRSLSSRTAETRGITYSEPIGSGSFYCDERSDVAGRRAVVRLGADHAADQGRHLIDAVRPLIGELASIVVFPASGVRAGTPGADNLYTRRATCGVGPDSALQIESATRPIDAAFQRRAGRALECEHCLGKNESESFLGSGIGVIGNRRRIVVK